MTAARRAAVDMRIEPIHGRKIQMMHRDNLEDAQRISLAGGVFYVPDRFANPGDIVFVTRDFRRWLWVLRETDWKNIAEKLSREPHPNENIYDAVRRMTLDLAESHAVTEKRTVRISDRLMAFAKIGDEAELLWSGSSLYLINPEIAQGLRAADGAK